MTVVENLFVHYNRHLEKGGTLHSALRILLQNLGKVPTLGIHQLADLCYTSPSTISRLVRRLGYGSYSVFQHSVATCLDHYGYHNTILPPHTGSLTPKQELGRLADIQKAFVDGITASIDMDRVHAFAQALHTADYVAIFPYVAELMEMPLQSDLMMSGTTCDIVMGDDDQLQASAGLPPNSVALAVCPDCFESYSKLSKLVENAKKCGAVVCVVSSSGAQSFCQDADYLFAFDGTHYMVDQFGLQTIVGILQISYRNLYIGHHRQGGTGPAE